MIKNKIINDKNIKQLSMDYCDLTLSGRRLNDLEMILDGSFYPLTSYLNKENYAKIYQTKTL